MPTSMSRLGRQALQNLDAQQPLDTKELHSRFYRARGEPTMAKLLLRLQLGAMQGQKKIVFSGHIGSGKSTELYNLKRTLDGGDPATVLYFPVKRHVNLVGMTSTRLLEAMARELERLLLKGAAPSPDFEEEIRRANETFVRKRIRKESVSGTARIGGEAGVASASGGADASRGTEQSWVIEELPDPTAMLDIVNTRLQRIRDQRQRPDLPILLICDDLEKLDAKTAEVVYSDGLALSEVQAAVIYTVPISLLYSERSKTLLGHFDDDWAVLPIIKIAARNGAPIAAGIGRLREMVKPRLNEHIDALMTPDAFERLAASSGGVLRDLIRMLREACLRIVAEDLGSPLTRADLRPVESELRRSFGRMVPSELVVRLSKVAQNSAARGMDAELARLLNLAAVLEYANDDTWYRVHPMAAHLFETVDAQSR